MTSSQDYQFEDVYQMCASYMAPSELDLIKRAYEFARQAHEGQMRLSGEPYIIHPVQVAGILAEIRSDADTVATGFLHDVVEDTDYTLEDMETNFSPTIAFLADGVTKLGQYQFKSKEEEQAENHRKMLLAMVKDVRVIIVKLADRLHNMRTMEYQSAIKQVEKSQEAIEIYAPLADRLGMNSIKWQLEDTGLRYINPEAYYDIVRKMDSRREEREEHIIATIQVTQERCREMGIEAEIYGRPKHIYSIYRKMVDQNKEFEDIFDLLAIRVLVESDRDCYAVLGAVHTQWKPLPGRFKDYIAMPKANMYQSLHTTVIGELGKPVEIQIRTHAMHEVAEYGVAAHWAYKQGQTAKQEERDDIQRQLEWLRDLSDFEDEARDASEFMDFVKSDFFNEEVYIFTPKGDVYELPTGSGPIDFAYHIHTEVGQKMIGAKVNGRIVSLDYRLQNGDIVEILTNPNSNGPSRDWLKFVKTSKAKNRIRRHFKAMDKERNAELGREILEEDLRKEGYSLKALGKEDREEKLLKRFNFSHMTDLYASIGLNEIPASTVINFLGLRKEKDKGKGKETNVTAAATTNPKRSRTVHESGVVVEGADNLMIRLSRCCNPVPGDEIVGYITRGRGISVHRADCPNLLAESDLAQRTIDVHWEAKENLTEDYETEVMIVGYDRSGFINDVLHVVSHTVKTLISVVGKQTEDSTATVVIKVAVSNTGQLNDLMSKLKNIPNTYSVNRVTS